MTEKGPSGYDDLQDEFGFSESAVTLTFSSGSCG